MSLNIKKERVHELVREAARRTGLSQTSVVEEALERYLEQFDQERERQREERGRRIDALLAEWHASGVADRIPSDTDFLYDENGLPA